MPTRNTRRASGILSSNEGLILFAVIFLVEHDQPANSAAITQAIRDHAVLPCGFATTTITSVLAALCTRGFIERNDSLFSVTPIGSQTFLAVYPEPSWELFSTPLSRFRPS